MNLQKPDKDITEEEWAEEKSDLDLMWSIAEPWSHQGMAVLDISLIATDEDIRGEMSLRTSNHPIQQEGHDGYHILSSSLLLSPSTHTSPPFRIVSLW